MSAVSDEREAEAQLTVVEAASGRQSAVAVRARETVRALKQRLAARSGVPATRQVRCTGQ